MYIPKYTGYTVIVYNYVLLTSFIVLCKVYIL